MTTGGACVCVTCCDVQL